MKSASASCAFRTIGFTCVLFTQALAAQNPASTNSTPAAPPPTPRHAEQGPHLSGEQVTIPLDVIKGYPFIQGSIDQHAGDLMLDTGMQPALIVNTLAVTPPNAIKIGHGSVTSGQSFDTLQFPQLDRLELPGGLQFDDSKFILGIPADFMQKGVDPHYIGSLGDDFFKSYVVKLDYAVPSVKFYHNDEAENAGETKAELGETVVQSIRLDIQGHQNTPFFLLTIAGAQAVAKLDTGAHVVLAVSKQQMTAMRKAGTLRKQGHNGYVLSGIVIDGHPIAPMQTQVMIGRSPLDSGLSTPDLPLVIFGYEFLSRYKTVWDYERATLTLLKLHP